MVMVVVVSPVGGEAVVQRVEAGGDRDDHGRDRQRVEERRKDSRDPGESQ